MKWWWWLWRAEEKFTDRCRIFGKIEDMEARTITRAEQALQGKTAGVQVLSASAKPGASPQVRIRGISLTALAIRCM